MVSGGFFITGTRFEKLLSTDSTVTQSGPDNSLAVEEIMWSKTVDHADRGTTHEIHIRCLHWHAPTLGQCVFSASRHVVQQIALFVLEFAESGLDHVADRNHAD